MPVLIYKADSVKYFSLSLPTFASSKRNLDAAIVVTTLFIRLRLRAARNGCQRLSVTYGDYYQLGVGYRGMIRRPE